MISRQQTQFKSFLSDQDSPNFVFGEDGELMFSNTAALKIFQRSGSLEVKSSSKVFQFRKCDGANNLLDIRDQLDLSQVQLSLEDILDTANELHGQGLIMHRSLDDGGIESARFFAVKVQSLTFDSKQCRILTLNEMTKMFECQQL